MNKADMPKHEDCKDVCQQADQYGVWPEHSCSQKCVWLKYGRDPQNETPIQQKGITVKKATSLADIGALMNAAGLKAESDPAISKAVTPAERGTSPTEVLNEFMRDIDIAGVRSQQAWLEEYKKKNPESLMEIRKSQNQFLLPNMTRTAFHELALKAVTNAYSMGRRDARIEAEAVQAMTESVLESRASHILPAAVAAVMENIGLTSLTLDLAAVASVFSRVSVDYELIDDGDGVSVEYRLTYKEDAK